MEEASVYGNDNGPDNNDITKQLLGVTGSVLAIFLFSAPYKDIFGSNGVYHNKNTNNLATGLPYFAAIFNCLAWVLYGAPEFKDYVMPCLINSFGLIINSAYAITYYRFASREEAVRCRYYLIAGLAIIAPGIGLEIIIGRATMGYIAAAMNILMFFSPLSAASEVIRTRSVAKFPFLPLLFSFLCGLSWTAYGVHTHDNPIIIPNACGVIFGIMQLGIYTWFSPRCYGRDPDSGFDPDSSRLMHGDEEGINDA